VTDEIEALTPCDASRWQLTFRGWARSLPRPEDRRPKLALTHIC
jgi:hypothetical protein